MMGNTVLTSVESNGHRANDGKLFTVEFTGRQVYALTELLRRVAVEDDSYLHVADAVKLVEFITEQARAQGF